MPLYDYSCQTCNHEFEALVFEGDKVECPQCLAKKVQRRLSMPAKPLSSVTASTGPCQSSGPPCGAPGCRRMP